jgi:hypothetical protein
LVSLQTTSGYKARLTPEWKASPSATTSSFYVCYFALDGTWYIALCQGTAGFSFHEDKDWDGIPKSVVLAAEDQVRGKISFNVR